MIVSVTFVSARGEAAWLTPIKTLLRKELPKPGAV